MNGFNFPEIGPVSPDVVLRNTVNAATLRAAESLPELKQQAQYGIPPSQEDMFDAVTADLTVKRVVDLLAIASHLLGDRDRSPCGICEIHYRNMRGIILILCSDHCVAPVPETPDAPISQGRSRRVRARQVLRYLSRLFGHNCNRICELCSVNILGFTSNPLDKAPTGTGIMNNGVSLIFNLCKDETI